MSTPLAELLTVTAESAELDFKSSFDPAHPGDWIELIKDVVAMSNSGGGTVLIGLNDEGLPSGADAASVLAVDPADITNKIHKYTATQFHAFEILECQKNDVDVCAIRVGAVRIPMVFTKVGTYETAPGKQKTVFSVGTVYFRHGAKSEPAASDDLRDFLTREVEATKRSWLDGIAKVVEAPTGSRVAILPPVDQPAGPSGAVPVQLTSDPTAPAYYAVPIDTTHPFRQKEVVGEVNSRLAGKKVITNHHVLCIRRVHQIQKNIAFCYTQNFASPRYSQTFVDWIITQYESDQTFFENTKAKFDQLKVAS